MAVTRGPRTEPRASRHVSIVRIKDPTLSDTTFFFRKRTSVLSVPSQLPDNLGELKVHVIKFSGRMQNRKTLRRLGTAVRLVLMGFAGVCCGVHFRHDVVHIWWKETRLDEKEHTQAIRSR